MIRRGPLRLEAIGTCSGLCAKYLTGRKADPLEESSTAGAIKANSLAQFRQQFAGESTSAIIPTFGTTEFGVLPERRQTVSATIKTREAGDVSIVEVTGRVTLGEATGKLRETVRELINKGRKYIILNLAGVEYMDSAGLGELVGAYTTVTNNGGQLKLVGVGGRTLDLLQVTKLLTVFECYDDEATAARSFPK